MRVLISCVFAVLFTATQSLADGETDKHYSTKDCQAMSGMIDFLLGFTKEKWKHQKAAPDKKDIALEISWAMDLAANYTTVYVAFCKSKP